MVLVISLLRFDNVVNDAVMLLWLLNLNFDAWNDHFDFDDVDLEGRAEVIILETEYSAVSTHIVQDIWCVQNEVF